MPRFEYRFTVHAPLAAVRAFHHDTSVLRKLSPPPLFVQVRQAEPLAEGSVADLRMWFGPVPVVWQAIHSNVGPGGFTDEQRHGPLRTWRHTHRFRALDEEHTLVEEEIDYEHQPGWRGLLTRLFFNRPALTLLFTYRQFVTRLSLGERGKGSWLPIVGAGLMLAAAMLRRRGSR